MTKAENMTPEQIAHTFCSWCNFRRFVAGDTFWGCGLEEHKKEAQCLYRKAVKKEQEGR